MGRRMSPKATRVERVMMPSTMVTRVPREILVYLWRIMEMMSLPPLVAPLRNIMPMATP